MEVNMKEVKHFFIENKKGFKVTELVNKELEKVQEEYNLYQVIELEEAYLGYSLMLLVEKK